MDVFDRFVRDFETKLNQLKLVEMGVTVSRDIDSAYRFILWIGERPIDWEEGCCVQLMASVGWAAVAGQ